MYRRVSVWLAVMTLFPAIAWGQFDSGSDGSDGALDCAAFVAMNPECPVDCDPATPCAVEIDLGLAADGSWDTPSPIASQGVYDPEKWAVVFKYTTIDIPAGVTVTFNNHPKNPPVVWLASGDVVIGGTVSLRGLTGAPNAAIPSFAEPGPGGFAGGRRGLSTLVTASGGFGPGGGHPQLSSTVGGGAGSYGSVGGDLGAPAGLTYGSAQVLPLIGGSGGGASNGSSSHNAGAGGGAILVGSSTTITLPSGGVIEAIAGSAETQGVAGSSGAIRLIANSIVGEGILRAPSVNPSGSVSGDQGGVGRIRVEADTISLTDIGTPQWTFSTPGPVFPPEGSPKLKATFVDAQSVPNDPDAGILTTDVEINNENAVTVNIEATNITVGTTVDVRVVPARGDVIIATSTPLADAGGGLLTATADVTLPPGRSEIQLRANWTP